MKKTIIILCMLLGISPTIAGSVNKNMQTTASLNAICTMSISSLDFGLIPAGNIVTSTTQLSILCSKNQPYTVAMSYPFHGQGNWGGIYASGMLMPQKANNTDWINYNIFLPDGTNWGSKEGVYNGDYGTVAGTPIGVLKGIGTGMQQNHSVKVLVGTNTYKIPSGYITPDIYRDTVTAVLTF